MSKKYILIKPLITEKSEGLSDNQNKYSFIVDKRANKVEIKKAVESLFGVKLKAVNTLVRKGKVKRFRGIVGKQSDFKKAIVTLVDGQSIDVTTGL